MRAIVNITCPHCGGRVDGIESIDKAQRIPCPYCRTELHVPSVGERVVVREMQDTPPVVETDHRRGAVAAVIVMAVVGMIAVNLYVRAGKDEAERVERWREFQRKDREQRDHCETSCKAGCPKGPDLDFEQSMCESRCLLSCLE